jgi:hypothetical protein
MWLLRGMEAWRSTGEISASSKRNQRWWCPSRRYIVGGVVATIAHLWSRCSRETEDLGLVDWTMTSLYVALPLGASSRNT